MALEPDQFDPTDPYAMVRRRVTNQMAGGGDAPPLDTPGVGTASPTPPAEFVPTERPDPGVSNPTPPATPTTPTGPPAPGDPGTVPSPGVPPGGGYPNPYDTGPWNSPNPTKVETGSWNSPNPNKVETPATTRPTGGSLNDPSYVRRLIAWAATQPGVNPSVKNDPNYWLSAVGRFGTDEGYFVQRMFTPEGPPEGARTGGGTGLTASTMLGAGGGLLGNYGLQAPQGIWSPDFVASLRQLIQERLKGASQPVDPNDPNINIPVTAARDQLTRQGETERSALAEHAYAQGGLNTDLIGRQIQQSNERSGQTLGNIRSQLIQREIVSRRSELQDLLSMVMAAGDSASARQIQLQIAALNAQLQEQGQAINLAEFGAQLNSNAALAGLRG